MQSATISIDKLVHGGQGLGRLDDGRAVFVWGALPGERVVLQLTKQKKTYAEAVALEILEASPDRVEPVEAQYLSTSPWQILDFTAEQHWKVAICQELFAHEGLTLPDDLGCVSDEHIFGYRNKMEFAFWADDSGLSLANYKRGSHGKIAVSGSALARDAVNEGATALLNMLAARGVHGRQLKTIIVRCSAGGEVVASLYTKDDQFAPLELPPELLGLEVYFSTPKSPASVPTKLLQSLGSPVLADILLGKQFSYGPNSFFQVNVPVYEQTLKQIKANLLDDLPVIDMYSGVGSIGLAVTENEPLSLVELDSANTAFAKLNAFDRRPAASIVQAASEEALDVINGSSQLLLDPPRAGLHKRLLAKLIESRPPRILYLSCNPSTQARDVALLAEHYEISDASLYNYFPRTPHIESLVILSARA